MVRTLLRKCKWLTGFSIAVLAMGQPAWSQVAIPAANVPYTQDFNALPATGSATFTQNSTLPGWYAERTGTGTTVVAGTGSSNAGNLYSFGTDADRALGAIGSSNAAAGNFAHGLRLKNTSGSTITTLTISYSGEQWRNSAAAAQTISFSYRVAPSFTGVEPSAALPAGYTALPDLDFTSPVTGGTAGVLDGNQAANRTVKTTTLNVTIQDGEEIMLRWYDPDHTGSDHGLAIDDVSVTATTEPSNSPSLAATPTTLSNFVTAQGTASLSQSYSFVAANLTDAISVVAPAGFAVSTDNTSFGPTATVPATGGTIYARLTGESAGAVSGTITNTSGAKTVTVTVSGTVTSNSPYTPIAQARAVPVGTVVTIAGRVTVSDQFGGRNLYIQDATGGINVYAGASPAPAYGSQVQLGDSVQLTGPLDLYQGKKEINGVTSFTLVTGVASRIPEPKVVTIDQLAANEGLLVKVVGSTISGSGATFGGNANYDFTASGQTGQLRINTSSPLAGATKPTGPVDVVGISERYTSGSSSVMQLLPRVLADIPGAALVPVSTTNCSGDGTVSGMDASLDVVTWNIEWFGHPTNGPSNNDLQANNVKQVIQNLNADVYGIEEVSDLPRFNNMVSQLNGYSSICSDRYSYSFNNPPDPYGQRVCFIYKTGTVTPVPGESRALLTNAPGVPANFWASGRYPFLFTADVKVNGVTKRIRFVDIHAKANTSNDPAGDKARRTYDAKVLKDSLDAQYPNDLIVLSGDYNDDVDVSISGGDSPYKPFVDDAANYRVLTSVFNQNNCATTVSYTDAIDHVTISNELFKAYIDNSATSVRPGIANYGTTTTDHYPTLVRFDLTKLVTPLVATAPANSASICSGSSAQVSVAVTGGSQPYAYAWTGPGTITNANSATATISGLTSGTQTFTVTVTDAANQSATATASVTVTAPVAPNWATISGQTYPAGQPAVSVNQSSGNVTFAATNCSGQLNWSGNGQAGTGNIVVPTGTAGVFVYTGTCTVNGCVSAPASVTVTVNALGLKVQHQDADGQPTNNVIKPNLQLSNEGSTAIPYAEITVRYWLTAENFTPLTNLQLNWAKIGTDKVKMRYVALPADQPRQGAFGYVEYSFDASAGSLAPNSNSGPINSQVAKQDWTNFNEADDYSYANNKNYTQTDRITAYRNGVLVWGVEPASVAPVTQLKALSENKNSKTTNNTISTYLQLSNEGNVPVVYSDLTVRYWFTSEGTQALNFYMDWAKMLGSNVKGKFVKLTTPLTGADTYLELSFAPSLGSFYPLSNTGNIQYRISKVDWTNFNEANDYSYKPAAPMAENNHITVYYKGQLVYGTEPATAVNARFTEGDAEPLQVQVLGNPIQNGQVELEVRGAKGAPLTMKLVNLQGSAFGEKHVDEATELEKHTLSLSNQPTGIYLLQVHTATQSVLIKVAKP